jgi:hypothetical protein
MKEAAKVRSFLAHRASFDICSAFDFAKVFQIGA